MVRSYTAWRAARFLGSTYYLSLEIICNWNEVGYPNVWQPSAKEGDIWLLERDGIDEMHAVG